MMADKAMIESGRDKRYKGSDAARWCKARDLPPSVARSTALNLNGFKAVLKSRLKAFRHLLCINRDAANAVAPYFIHIVRANRTDDMVGFALALVRQVDRKSKR